MHSRERFALMTLFNTAIIESSPVHLSTCAFNQPPHGTGWNRSIGLQSAHCLRALVSIYTAPLNRLSHAQNAQKHKEIHTYESRYKKIKWHVSYNTSCKRDINIIIDSLHAAHCIFQPHPTRMRFRRTSLKNLKSTCVQTYIMRISLDGLHTF